MKNAISAALDDQDFQAITFQSLEDTQSVLITTEQQLDNTFEFTNQFLMHVVLMTQRTTAPDTARYLECVAGTLY